MKSYAVNVLLLDRDSQMLCAGWLDIPGEAGRLASYKASNEVQSVHFRQFLQGEDGSLRLTDAHWLDAADWNMLTGGRELTDLLKMLDAGCSLGESLSALVAGHDPDGYDASLVGAREDIEALRQVLRDALPILEEAEHLALNDAQRGEGEHEVYLSISRVVARAKEWV